MTKKLLGIGSLVSLAVAGLWACGGGGGGSTYTENDYCNSRANAECTNLSTACAFTPAQLMLCEANRVSVCLAEGTALKKPGTRDFNEARAKACISRTKSLFQATISAANWKTLQDECRRTFAGDVAATKPCEIDLDCNQGLICDSVYRVCVARKTVGANAPCNNPGEVCPTGQYCTVNPNASAPTRACFDRAPLEGACSAERPCKEGLRCDAATAKCAMPQMTGAACAVDADCDATMNLFCEPLNNRCGTTVNFAARCEQLGGGLLPTPDAASTPVPDAGTD